MALGKLGRTVTTGGESKDIAGVKRVVDSAIEGHQEILILIPQIS